MLRVKKLLFFFPLLISCSGSQVQILTKDLIAPNLLSRGWIRVESSKELENVPAGKPMLYYSNMELMDNLLIYTSERFGVTVLNKYTGEVKWKKAFPGGARSGVLVFRDTIYLGGNDGFARAFHMDGKEIWKLDLYYPIQGKPLIIGNLLFFSTINNTLHAVERKAGKLVWSYPHSVDTRVRIRGGGNISHMYKQLWVGFDDGTLLALRPKDAFPLFKRRFPHKGGARFFDLDARPIAWKKGVLVTVFGSALYYIKKDGSILWSFPAGSAHAPVTKGNMIYLASDTGVVYSIHGNKGVKRWEYALPKGVPTGISLLSTKSVLLVSSSQDYVYALDSNTGKLLDAEYLGSGSGTYGSILVDKDEKTFYLVSLYGRVFQFRIGKFK